MKDYKFDKISTEEAVQMLTAEIMKLTNERDKLIARFKDGEFSCDFRIKALSKGIMNDEAILTTADMHEFRTRKKNLFVRVPIMLEEYNELWDEDNQEWVVSKPKQYDTVGFVKPRFVPAGKTFIQSNISEIKHSVEELNNEHIMPVYCKVCDMPFAISPNERAFFFKQGIPLPKRCPACRAINRARKEKQEDGVV